MSDMTDNSDRGLLHWTVLLVSGALFMMVAFQTYILLQAGENLVRVRASQDTPVKNGQELQKKVEDLAGRVASLAQGGNANAKLVVDSMARQGVRLAPPGANPPASSAPTN